MKPATEWFSNQGKTLKAAWQGGTEWWGKMGTKVSEGWEKGSAWFTKRGEDLSRGLTSLKDSKWAKGLGTAIGSGIAGAKTHLQKAGETMGRWLGGGMSTSGSFKSIGGMIGVGIGAVAIGAAIGYAIWKKYQEYQAGKDVTIGKDRLHQVRYLESMGMTEDQALTMQATFVDEGVSMSKGGIERYMTLAQNMADQVRMFKDVNVEDLEAMERGEQNLYAKQLEQGLYGDSSLYSGIIKIIRDQQWGADQGGRKLGSALTGVTEAIQTKASLKTSQEELESRWYAFNAPVLGHIDLSGGGYLNTAKWANIEDEKRLRESLGDRFTDKAWNNISVGNLRTRYTQDLTKLEAEMGFWLTALEGNAASSFLTPEAQRNLVDKKFTDDELVRMAKGVSYNFNVVDSETGKITMTNIGPADMEALKNAIANQWELVGVVLP
jgi:hypothetical protein